MNFNFLNFKTFIFSHFYVFKFMNKIQANTIIIFFVLYWNFLIYFLKFLIIIIIIIK